MEKGQSCWNKKAGRKVLGASTPNSEKRESRNRKYYGRGFNRTTFIGGGSERCSPSKSGGGENKKKKGKGKKSGRIERGAQMRKSSN